jgi:hypothetical protein
MNTYNNNIISERDVYLKEKEDKKGRPYYVGTIKMKNGDFLRITIFRTETVYVEKGKNAGSHGIFCKLTKLKMRTNIDNF